MTRILMLLLPCTALYALSGGSPAAAQDPGRVNVFGAGSFLAAERAFSVDDNDDFFRTTYQTGGKVGFRYTADLNEFWAGEAGYSLGRNSLRVTDLDQPNTFSIFEINVHQFSANALYYFNPPAEDLRPFVTFGLGVTRFSPTDDAQANAAQNLFGEPAVINGSTKFGVNFGGGVENRMSDRMGMRFDVRDHLMAIPRYGLPEMEPSSGSFYPVDGSVHNFELGVGIVFYLR